MYALSTWLKDLMSTIGGFFVRLGKGIINFIDTEKQSKTLLTCGR